MNIPIAIMLEPHVATPVLVMIQYYNYVEFAQVQYCKQEIRFTGCIVPIVSTKMVEWLIEGINIVVDIRR